MKRTNNNTSIYLIQMCSPFIVAVHKYHYTMDLDILRECNIRNQNTEIKKLYGEKAFVLGIGV